MKPVNSAKLRSIGVVASITATSLVLAMTWLDVWDLFVPVPWQDVEVQAPSTEPPQDGTNPDAHPSPRRQSRGSRESEAGQAEGTGVREGRPERRLAEEGEAKVLIPGQETLLDDEAFAKLKGDTRERLVAFLSEAGHDELTAQALEDEMEASFDTLADTRELARSGEISQKERRGTLRRERLRIFTEARALLGKDGVGSFMEQVYGIGTEGLVHLEERAKEQEAN